MLTAEQHETRRGGLGSSDISAIVGENPFKTPHDVWLDKRGLVEPSEETDATWLGHEMEPIIGKRYTRETGIELTAGPGTVKHAELPWALCTTDWESVIGDRIVECKWVGGRVDHHWTLEADGAPEYVQCQAQWQMGVRGMERADVAVIFGRTAEFRFYKFERDEKMIESLFAIGRRFWERHVLTGEPLPVDHTDSARKMLLAYYGKNKKLLRPATRQAEELFERCQAAADARAEAERLENLAKNQLCELIGDAEGFKGDFGSVTWKADKRGRRSLRFYPRKVA